jgi:uncharacterized protein YqfA (UPF0365 family)
MEWVIPGILLLGLVIVFFAVLFSFIPLRLWISAKAAQVQVGIFSLVGMRLRRVLPAKIVNPLIKATKGGVDVSVNQLEGHFLAGGNVDRVVNALIAAQRAEFPFPLSGPRRSIWPAGTCSRRCR